jgi:hypothetical protein
MIDTVSPLDFDHFEASLMLDTFQVVVDMGLSASCSTLRIINMSNMSIIISFDGTNDNDCVITGKSLNLLTSTNSKGDNRKARFSKGQRIWVRRYLPEKFPDGMIYICGVH